jgi:hypothetical protein
MVNGVRMTRRTQPRLYGIGEKYKSRDARYPISQKRVPRPAVSLRTGCIRFVGKKRL